jgi:hypothetical protein
LGVERKRSELSAGSFAGRDLSVIGAPLKSYDEPEILPSSTQSRCLKKLHAKEGSDIGDCSVRSRENAAKLHKSMDLTWKFPIGHSHASSIGLPLGLPLRPFSHRPLLGF